MLVPQHFIHRVFTPEHGGLVEAVAEDGGSRAVPQSQDALFLFVRRGKKREVVSVLIQQMFIRFSLY